MRHLQGFRDFDILVRDQEVEGSNPFAPTTLSRLTLPSLFQRSLRFVDQCGPNQSRRTPFFELGEETLLIDFAHLKEAEGCITALGQRVRQPRFSNDRTSLWQPHAPQQLAQSCVLA